MAKIRWTAEAERWLDEIYHYIGSDSPIAAHKTVVSIYEAAQTLAEFPEMGYCYEAGTHNVRVMIYGHYRIAYLIKAGDNIDILGVFHGAMELERYLTTT